MNLPRQPPRPRVCPSCGAAINLDGMVCPSCGGVVAIEIASRRLRDHIAGQTGRARANLRDPATLIWVLALIPILIAPPLIALFLIYRAGRDKPRTFDFALAATVALLNVVLSILFWRRLGLAALDFGPGLWFFFNSLGVHHAPPAKPTLI